jgi:hypothetical protein
MEDVKMEESKEELEKRMAEEIEKKVEEGVKAGTAILVAVTITFILSVIVFKFVWAWVVPDLFPGAVAQGLISADLTWIATLKLAVLVAVLSGFYPSLIEAFKTRA